MYADGDTHDGCLCSVIYDIDIGFLLIHIALTKRDEFVCELQRAVKTMMTMFDGGE